MSQFVTDYTGQESMGSKTLCHFQTSIGEEEDPNEVEEVLAMTTFDSPIDLYPNPSFGSINVKLPGITSVSSFKLIDLSGRSQEIDVRRVDADNYLVEFKEARKGIYYLEIHSENYPVVRKRIINY